MWTICPNAFHSVTQWAITLPWILSASRNETKIHACELQSDKRWAWVLAKLTLSLPERMRINMPFLMIIIVFITFNISLVPLIEGVSGSNSWEFEFTGFRRNPTDDLGINSLRSDQLSHACTWGLELCSKITNSLFWNHELVVNSSYSYACWARTLSCLVVR